MYLALFKKLFVWKVVFYIDLCFRILPLCHWKAENTGIPFSSQGKDGDFCLVLNDSQSVESSMCFSTCCSHCWVDQSHVPKKERLLWSPAQSRRQGYLWFGFTSIHISTFVHKWFYNLVLSTGGWHSRVDKKMHHFPPCLINSVSLSWSYGLLDVLSC